MPNHPLPRRQPPLNTFVFSTLLSLISTVFAAPLLATSTQEEETLITDEVAEAQLSLQQLRHFVNAFSQIRRAYVEPVDDAVLLENAIKGMLFELDPHSNYLEPQSFSELQNSASGSFSGIGVEVGMEDSFIKVISPIDGSPAEKAGIASGDLIVKIDGTPTKGLSLAEAVEKMRGRVGSELTLRLHRHGSVQPIDLTLTRQRIAVASVRGHLLEPGYLYLRIAQFQNDTGRDVKETLRRLTAESGGEQTVRGIVLDLRNNPGGVLHAAVDVVDHFIDSGLIVYTEGRNNDSAIRFEASAADDTNHALLTVLINRGSASAAEIVAGALQDHRRAVVLGSNSFGKGSVQTVIPLSESHGIKLTTARYYTPHGRSIQAQGIAPNIAVEMAKITRLDESSALSEADLHGHLKNTDSRTGESQHKKKNNDADKADNQLQQALTLLKGGYLLQRGTDPAENPLHSTQ